MIHVRVDDKELNSKRRFRCGLGPELPPGDVYYFAAEYLSRTADCPGCNPGGPPKLGTPISELGGRPGHEGFDKFCELARSWGYP